MSSIFHAFWLVSYFAWTEFGKNLSLDLFTCVEALSVEILKVMDPKYDSFGLLSTPHIRALLVPFGLGLEGESCVNIRRCRPNEALYIQWMFA